MKSGDLGDQTLFLKHTLNGRQRSNYREKNYFSSN